MIPLSRPYFNAAEIKEVKKVLESGWVTQGQKVKEFEKKFAQYIGVKYAVACSSCTTALHLALLSLGVKKGDEVIVADFTFPATGHAVLYCDAKPIFVDVNPKTYNIEPRLVEKAISKRTKAIIPVHTFGQCARMPEIMEIADKFEIPVIEDAACAHGSKFYGKKAGSFGRISCFSFHARKNLVTGEGGMILTNDEKIACKARYLSTFGMTSAWEREKTRKFIVPVFKDVGFNYKLSDIAAAIGIAQLRKLDEMITRKRQLAKVWDEQLSKLDYINQPFVDEGAFHVYQSYVAVTDKRINRNKLIYLLKQRGIQTQIGTYASHVQPVYHSRQKLPNSLLLFKQTIALPLFFTLKENEIEWAAKKISKALKESKR